MDDPGLFTFHLTQVPVTTTVALMRRAPQATGLRHAECLSLMRLGAPTVSPDRIQLRRLAMFARWDDEGALESFLAGRDGEWFAAGWHIRMMFLRRWSQLAALADLPARADSWTEEDPVVAVTMARLRLPEVPRFLAWGKPVERLVRDHPGATLAVAAMRPPRSISTFSIWESVREMTDMVHGHSTVDGRTRHADAMAERSRRDFHREFATFRFRPVSEHGSWQGRGDYLPRRSNL